MKSASSSLIIILSLLTSYVLCAVDYTTEIQLIFTNNCTVCHSGPSPSGGLDLSEQGDSYENLVNVTSNNYGPAIRIEPNNLSNSVLYNKITDTQIYGQDMPPGASELSQGDIDLIAQWINEGADATLSSIISPSNTYPNEFSIIRNYPNPFNPVTRITYGLPVNTDVQIVVYDISGNRIQSLRNEFQTAGYYSINWNASSYPSGVYLIRMESGEFTQTQKVVLVK